MIKAKVRRQFEPLSDFEIEAYLCGELSESERARVEACSASEPALRAYLERRQAARARFAQQHPLRLTREPKGIRVRMVVSMLGLAAVAMLGVVAVTPELRAPEAEGGSTPAAVRVKGAAALQASLSVQRGQQRWLHRPEIPLRPDDQLMLTLETEGPGYVTLLGRDARGEIAVYYDALPVAGGRFIAPTSLTLDSQPGDELWLAVFSREQRDARAYVAMFARDQPWDLAHSFFPIRKAAQ